ncbi:accessory Sec system protein Asp3 [Liquorilactobacillus uvarum]|uniref:Accessory Sec system protein Asp3 n=1 Tax=Liquorilactobacillus uvarum DSM 19971 TaxID=1423812 RepID=A0A0R1PXC4_9LACO|nr:accessory Sec system protein Asp3 [Liquorilactobacillus uvarum]KRL35060.1 hypothetical protein FD20_GL001527 [Liquorilactobacillus uvarum DSM 19971]
MIGYTANIIYWKAAASTYLYGSKVIFHQNGEVDFENKLMSPGKTVNTWYSQTNYQAKRFSPQLPILKKGKKYRLLLRARSFPEATLYLRLDFYDRSDLVIKQIFIKEMEEAFEYPDGAYYYTISLLNAGCVRLRFRYLVLAPVEFPSARNTEILISRIYNVHASNELNIIFEEPSLNACTVVRPEASFPFKNCVFVQSMVLNKKAYMTEFAVKRIEKICRDFKKITTWGCGPLSNVGAEYYAKILLGTSVYTSAVKSDLCKGIAAPLFSNSTDLHAFQQKNSDKSSLRNTSKVSE